jgi:hypothetical protein
MKCNLVVFEVVQALQYVHPGGMIESEIICVKHRHISIDFIHVDILKAVSGLDVLLYASVDRYYRPAERTVSVFMVEDEDRFL